MKLLWFGFIRRIATAIGSGGQRQKRQSTLRTAAIVIGMVREYKLDSLDRIEDAVVGLIEAEAQEAKADADFRIAEAAERQARSALTLAEARGLQAKTEASVIESSATADANRLKAIADAVAKLADAVAKLKRAGGSVAVIEHEIALLLGHAKTEFPEDKIIATADEHITPIEPLTESPRRSF